MTMAPHAPPSVSRDEDSSFSSSSKQGPDVTTFKYYFILFALLIVLLALIFSFTYQCKVRQRARRTGQQAPARDVEAWPGTRRLIHGRYGAGNPVLLRRTEGLDEHGEAPPPYQPKTETEATTMFITMPMRTLLMDEGDQSGMVGGGGQPPQYCDREHMPSTPSTRREAAQPEEERGTKA